MMKNQARKQKLKKKYNIPTKNNFKEHDERLKQWKIERANMIFELERYKEREIFSNLRRIRKDVTLFNNL